MNHALYQEPSIWARRKGSAVRAFLLVTASLHLACGAAAVHPRAHFLIDDPFSSRVGRLEVTGVEVKSALSEGSLSDEDLEKLAGYVCADLRKATISKYLNLNAGADPGLASRILTIEVNLVQIATPEEQRDHVPSYLNGTVSFHRVATGANLGSARVWARGSSLGFQTNYVPNTVREFTSAIHKLINAS